MAELNIEIKTGDAADKLAELAAGLDTAAQAAEKAAPAFSALDPAAASLANVKPIDPAVPESLDKVTEGVQKLGEAAPSVDTAAASLEKVGAAAPGLESAAAAAEKAAESVTKLGESGEKSQYATEGLRKFAEAAEAARHHSDNIEKATTAADEAMRGFGSQALHAVEHMTGFGGAANFASKAFATFAEVGGGLPGMLAAVATAIFAIDFSKISEEALKASFAVEKLQRSLNAFSKDAHAAPEALETLSKIADKLGLDLEKLEKGFGKFAAVATSAGFSSKWAADAFGAVQNAARATGTGLEGAERVLRTLETWMSTGTMTAGLLGRSLRDVGLTLDQIDPKFKGATRNTQVGTEALNQLLVAMNNMKTEGRVLQEEVQRVANAWHEMMVAFGEGQMQSQVSAMKFLADQMKEAGPAMRWLANVAGELWGALQSLGNYVEGSFIAAFGAAIGWVRDMWNILSQATLISDDVKAAFSGLGSVLSWIGGLFGELGKLIGPAFVMLMQLFVIGLYAIHAAFREVGEDVGILAGALAGALVLAFNAVIGKIGEFCDWMSQGVDKIKEWMATNFPEWLRGYLAGALDWVRDSIRSMRDEWNEATAAAARLRGEVERLKPTTEELTGAQERAAKAAANQRLELEKLSNAAREAAKAQADMAKEIDRRAAIVMQDPNWEANDNAIKQQKASQATANAWSQKVASDAQGDNNPGQYSRAGGRYSGRDLIRGTGVFRSDSGGADGLFTPSPAGSFQRGGQVGPQDQFNSGPPQRVTLTDASGAPISDINPLGGMPFSQIPMAQGGTPFDQISGGTHDNLSEMFKQTGENFNKLIGEIQPLTSALAGETGAFRDGAAASREAAGEMSKLGGDMTGLDDGMNRVGDQLDSVGNSIDAMGNAIDANTQATDTNNLLTNTNNFWTQQEAAAQEANTAATEADTAANYADAAAQSGGGGGGGGDNSGNPGGGGQQDAQASSTTQYDVGGVVGRWGGRPGPGLPMSAWNNAPHFAAGGTTGIPIIAHDNEAIIPLQGGAVPVRLQGFADIGEKIINVGTLAHNDATLILAQLTAIGNNSVNLIAAFNTVSAHLQSSGSGSSSSSGSGARSSNSAAGGGMGLGTNDAGIGGGAMHRGYWGTASVQQPDGSWKNIGYLPATSNNVYTGYGGNKINANGKSFPMGGAADGLENTNMIPGMNPNGMPINVHPNEAITPLAGGRAIPVIFPQMSGGVFSPGWSGQAPGGPGRDGARGGGSPIYVTNNIQVRDAKQYTSPDQNAQETLKRIYRATSRLGQTSPIDDPTIRQTGWGGQRPGMTNPVINGTAKF